jgi:geranylgeranyl transferase type-2 subunit alpha
MHGQKREQYKARMHDPKVAAGLQHKANQWFKLHKDLMQRGGSLDLTANMLMVNPDPVYLWNRRRSLLCDDDDLKDLHEELSLTRKCLERNPKAYGAWFHRKWCILKAGREEVVLKKELGLCAVFLNLDERNFHCWNYRRFIVGCLLGSRAGEIVLSDDQVLFGRQVGGSIEEDKSGGVVDETKVLSLLESEFDFTTEKIEQNFSNGSAFHYRSKLLTHISKAKFSLENELELIHNAVFTEPDDQTAWWYLDFLLENYKEDIDLESEKSMLEELIEAEGGQTKWGLLGLYQVLVRMEDHQDQRREILASLKTIDPDRSARYEEMLKRIK